MHIISYYTASGGSGSGDFSGKEEILLFMEGGPMILNFTIRIINDIKLESDENFVTSLGLLPMENIPGLTISPDESDINIRDDDSKSLARVALMHAFCHSSQQLWSLDSSRICTP